jgi:hypothetical protein
MTRNFYSTSGFNCCNIPSTNFSSRQISNPIIPNIRLSSASLQSQYYNTFSTPVTINSCCNVSPSYGELPGTLINALSKSAGIAVGSLSSSDIGIIVRGNMPSSNYSTSCCILKEWKPYKSSKYLSKNYDPCCYNSNSNILLLANSYIPISYRRTYY